MLTLWRFLLKRSHVKAQKCHHRFKEFTAEYKNKLARNLIKNWRTFFLHRFVYFYFFYLQRWLQTCSKCCSKSCSPPLSLHSWPEQTSECWLLKAAQTQRTHRLCWKCSSSSKWAAVIALVALFCLNSFFLALVQSHLLSEFRNSLSYAPFYLPGQSDREGWNP